MTLTVETWCEALESGKYEQGRKKLRVEDRFCCLGVACDLSGIVTWDGGKYLTSEEVLPTEVSNTLGLAGPDGNGSFEFSELPIALQAEVRSVHRNFDPNEPPQTLANLNDNGVPFPLIAKVIRARPKGLFREDAP